MTLFWEVLRVMLFWAALVFVVCVSFTILLILTTMFREAICAYTYAKRIAAAEKIVHGKQLNSNFALWWFVYAGPESVTVYNNDTIKHQVVYRYPQNGES